MKQIHVTASRSYPVFIGSGLLASPAEKIRQATAAQKICLVSDENIWPLHGASLEQNLEKTGFSVCHFIIQPGEEQKNGQNYLALLEYLAENKLTRNDCLIALGGGVVGDLTGFAAATYLRGISYVQIPTTLLAMVDSSVGGKTAIDLPAGKNLCGAFWQPSAVLCDTDVLTTLPEDVFRDGCAEVIKYAVLFDPELFAVLERDGLNFDWEWVIARCIQHKCNVVSGDEFDHGNRMLLNYGHTIGHAIEACSQYTISHGKAIAMGMAILCRATASEDAGRIIALLEKFGLPITTDLAAENLYAAMLSDKKRGGDFVHLIVSHSVGSCKIVPTAVCDLKTLLKEGL